MSTTSNTAKDLYDHLKFLTGKDSLSTADANRLFKYAIDDYSYFAMVSDGVHKFDDTTHVNSSGNKTYPIASGTVGTSRTNIPLDATFLQLDRVSIVESDGSETPLTAIDRRDYKDQSLTSVFGTGKPTAYDYDAHGVRPYPVPDASYTIKVYYSRAAKYIDVTDDSEEIGIPRFHHYYLILHACRQLGFRTIDSNRVDIASELMKWEGNEETGTKGKIYKYYTTRDEDRARRIKPKRSSTFNRTFNKR